MSKKHTYLINNGLKSIEPKDILKEGYDKFYFIHHPYRYFKDVIYRYFKYKRKEKQKGFNPVNTWDLSSYFWHHLFEMIEDMENKPIFRLFLYLSFWTFS